MPARILVVEDDSVVAETVEAYLQQAGYEVTVIRDGRAAVAHVRDDVPALVILDLMIPGLPGLDVCRQLRHESHVPVLMLTARTTEQDRLRGFETGADDYVAKPFSPRELVCRVQALLRRTSAAADGEPRAAPWRHGDLSIDRWAREVRVSGARVATTRTEYAILDVLVRGDGRTFTRDELLSRVFGPDYDGTDRTIDTHVTNLRRKLDPVDGQRFVLTVHGVGYRWRGRDA
jgi:DNA-binding response OmpR family regulator